MDQTQDRSKVGAPDQTAVLLGGPIVPRVREAARRDERSIRQMVTILCREALDARAGVQDAARS